METKSVLAIVAIAMFALAIAQVQAESINVPNGSFELIYKPGSTTITANTGGGWTMGVGPDAKMENGLASYSDGTSGGYVDIPGWINAPDWPKAYDGWDKGSGSVAGQTTPPDGEYYFTGNGGGWSVPGGGCAESDAPLVYNIDGTYRITALYNSEVTPVAFDLLAGDVVITPSSSVDPPDPYSWDEFSRTYDIATLAPHVGEPLRIRAGWGPDAINNQGHLDVVTLEVFNRIFPSPEYGERVLVDENLELSWTLPSDSNDVWVDVWFGTEPNALSDNYDMTKVVDAATDGKNTEAVLVDASEPDTYYWQINSYVNGAGHINDANMIEGFVLLFYAVDDVAPTVEIVTPDHMTWSGEGVPLVAEVADDAASALTIEWSADLPDDISAAFDPPEANTANPTVTITKLPTSVIAVPDASFEDHVLAEGGYEDIGTAGYTGAWESHSGDAWIDYGYWRADGYPEDLYANSGNNKAYGYEDYIYQILDETFIEGRTYTLSVLVGQPFVGSDSGWSLHFTTEDYTDELIAASGTAGLSWEQVSLSYTATDADAGKKIGIKMWGNSDVAFDDVQLTVDPPVAPPVVTVTVTVAVSDVANPTPDTASIEIDVYDDACHLARVGEGKSAVTDFNANCITALEDLAVVAAAWLDDYAPTGPIDRQ